MDYWKELAWDPPGLEQSSGGLGGQKNGGASVDLSLGETFDSVEKPAAETSKDSRDSKSSSSGSSKRIRMQNGSQNTTCSVDGCNSDLSNCREYHRRHRVCEKHSKTPVVLVGGKQQRFCQQCSRFHSLGEFDEVKRSCRKRLDGHNRRRRKPQPPSLFMAAEKFLSSYKGPRLLQFDNPQSYAPFLRSFWPPGAKTEVEPMLYDRNRHLHSFGQQSLLNSVANTQHQQDQQVPIVQANDPKAGYGNEAVPEIAISQEISGAIAPPAGGKASQKLSSNGKPESKDSGCALYLLSTLQTQNSELNLVQSNITCPTQSPPDVHFDTVNKYSGSESAKDRPAAPVFVLDANAANVHCNGMIRSGPDGLVDTGDLLTLPFFWE